jgi:hypothetical protein
MICFLRERKNIEMAYKIQFFLHLIREKLFFDNEKVCPQEKFEIHAHRTNGMVKSTAGL